MVQYNADYWRWLESQGIGGKDAAAVKQAIPVAKAFMDAARVNDHAKVLDYGCGQGILTAALLRLGYQALGVDTARWPIAHCHPEAKGHVQHLEKGLDSLKGEQFDVVVAKDVFEHIDQAVLAKLVAQLMEFSNKIIFLCPTTDANHRFICPNDEEDDTHITRMTAAEWLQFFPFAATRHDAVTRIARGSRTAHGSVCVLLEG